MVQPSSSSFHQRKPATRLLWAAPQSSSALSDWLCTLLGFGSHLLQRPLERVKLKGSCRQRFVQPSIVHLHINCHAQGRSFTPHLSTATCTSLESDATNAAARSECDPQRGRATFRGSARSQIRFAADSADHSRAPSHPGPGCKPVSITTRLTSIGYYLARASMALVFVAIRVISNGRSHSVTA